MKFGGKTLAGFGRAILMEKREIEWVDSHKVLQTLVHNRGLVHLSLIIDANQEETGRKQKMKGSELGNLYSYNKV